MVNMLFSLQLASYLFVTPAVKERDTHHPAPPSHERAGSPRCVGRARGDPDGSPGQSHEALRRRREGRAEFVGPRSACFRVSRVLEARSAAFVSIGGHLIVEKKRKEKRTNSVYKSISLQFNHFLNCLGSLEISL